MIKKHIPVSQPLLGESEVRYLNDALSKGAISGLYGKYITRFETEFAQYSDCAFGVSVVNGTTAIHLALAALSIGEGDEVLVSTLTNMATCFPILYQRAKPVPIDIEEETWNLDPRLLEAKITRKTKAILVVHLFGHSVDMDPVLEIARKYKLFVIEDCAEAHGALYKGKKAGSLGDIGCFSFYANKIITTGEGGMITTNNRDLAEKCRNLKNLAYGSQNKFQHGDVGYNYRMTNLQAALGCAQMEKIEQVIAAKRRIAVFYNESLKNCEALQLPIEKSYARNVYWMYHVALRGGLSDKRAEIMKNLSENGIETREGFIPYNMQDLFLQKGWTKPEDCPLARDCAYSTFYLPTGASLEAEDLDYIVNQLCAIIRKK